MKKVIFGLAVVAAAAFGAYTANMDNAVAQMSDLQMDEIETLADGEPGFIGKGEERPSGHIIYSEGRPRYFRFIIECLGDNPSNCVPCNKVEELMKEQ